MNARKRLFRRLEKVDRALRGSGKPAERVHEARRQIKRARAVLALGRAALGRGRARRAEKELRAAGRALSGVRDAETAARAYESLRPHPRGELDALRARRKAAELSTGLAARAAGRRVEAAREELARMGRAGRGALARAARRALEEVQKLGEAALLTPDDEKLHSWRKAAKRLDGMLGEADAPTPRMRRLRERLAELGDALGEDHDLVTLREALKRDGGCAPVKSAAARRRAEMLEKAARLAPALARETPRRVARDFRRSI